MLPAAHRLSGAESFRAATRRGRRGVGDLLVAHLDRPAASGSAAPARVGFVVSKAVGGAVVRNRVRRRLRHLVCRHLDLLPDGSVLVVRALPAAAGASSAELGSALEASLSRIGLP